MTINIENAEFKPKGWDCTPKDDYTVIEYAGDADKFLNDCLMYRAVEIRPGDSFFVYVKSPEEEVKLGQQWQGQKAFVTEIYYAPKKWWQFWKKKRQTGYKVQW